VERAMRRGKSFSWRIRVSEIELSIWNLVLMRSDMKGIFRSVWIAWFDRYQG
jgi:hypothetical protein